MSIEPVIIVHKCSGCGNGVEGKCNGNDKLVTYEVDLCLHCLREKADEIVNTAFRERGICSQLGQVEEMRGIDRVINIVRGVLK